MASLVDQVFKLLSYHKLSTFECLEKITVDLESLSCCVRERDLIEIHFLYVSFSLYIFVGKEKAFIDSFLFVKLSPLYLTLSSYYTSCSICNLRVLLGGLIV